MHIPISFNFVDEFVHQEQTVSEKDYTTSCIAGFSSLRVETECLSRYGHGSLDVNVDRHDR